MIIQCHKYSRHKVIPFFKLQATIMFVVLVLLTSCSLIQPSQSKQNGNTEDLIKPSPFATQPGQSTLKGLIVTADEKVVSEMNYDRSCSARDNVKYVCDIELRNYGPTTQNWKFESKPRGFATISAPSPSQGVLKKNEEVTVFLSIDESKCTITPPQVLFQSTSSTAPVTWRCIPGGGCSVNIEVAMQIVRNIGVLNIADHEPGCVYHFGGDYASAICPTQWGAASIEYGTADMKGRRIVAFEECSGQRLKNIIEGFTLRLEMSYLHGEAAACVIAQKYVDTKPRYPGRWPRNCHIKTGK